MIKLLYPDECDKKSSSTRRSTSAKVIITRRSLSARRSTSEKSTSARSSSSTSGQHQQEVHQILIQYQYPKK